MLEFKKAELADKMWVDECLLHCESYNCECTFGNLFIWSTSYFTRICHYKDFLIIRWGREPEDYSYSVPIGQGDFREALDAIIATCIDEGHPFQIYGITEPYIAKIKSCYDDDKFTFTFDDGNFDYIYSVEKMASLSGKKYHSKRNHISNFKRTYPDWSFETIDESNIDECIALHTKWIEEKDENDSDYSFEFEAVLNSFQYFKELELVGGLIRVDGEVVAYTVGEGMKNGKCFVTHFEKAPPEMNGAYTIINQEFTKNCLMSYEWVNREEDLGLEGLRKAKQSYYPEIWLKKGMAVYNG